MRKSVASMGRVGAFAVLLAGMGLVACGAAAPSVALTSPFTEEHAAVFRDGIEFIERPEDLTGVWLDEWDRDFQRRIALGDFVALVEVTTVRTDTDLQQRQTLRLVAEIKEVLLGRAPENEVTLVIREGAEGYATVAHNDSRVLHRRFVAFIKWYATDAGTLGAHWFLAPASDSFVARTREAVDAARGAATRSRQRVIVREN